MGLLSRLLGNDRAAKARAEKAGAPGASQQPPPVTFDPGLIARLKDDHRELLRTFGAARTAITESRFGDIAHLLSHFRQAFRAHIATEAARLYPYLQQRVARDAEAAALLAQAHREMNEIAFEVLQVVDAYLAHPPTHLNEGQFQYDIERVSALLAQRVQQVEARLYPLYHA